MISRALLLAAVAALVSAQEPLLPCVDTDTCHECCPPEKRLFVDPSDGKAYCIDIHDDSNYCTLCEAGGLCAAKDGFLEVTGLTGSTSGGGASVGTSLRNPMRGFLKVPSPVAGVSGSMFDKFEHWQLGARATRYEYHVDSIKIHYSCENLLKYPGCGACDAFLFVFRCNPCPAENSGLLHAHLTQNGWKVHHCGPVFKFPEDASTNAHEHRFITYHKEITGHEMLDLSFETDFILPAVGPKAAKCSTLGDEQACNNAGSCSWNDDLPLCEPGWCPKHQNYVGPSTGCTVCPRNPDGTYNFNTQ